MLRARLSLKSLFILYGTVCYTYENIILHKAYLAIAENVTCWLISRHSWPVLCCDISKELFQHLCTYVCGYFLENCIFTFSFKIDPKVEFIPTIGVFC